MIQLSSPMRVTPTSCTVPRLMVQNSRMVLRSPISSRVGSSRYFLSCGAPPIELKELMWLSRPIRVTPSITTCEPTLVPGPISTSGPTRQKAPISTSGASFAAGSICAVGWIATSAAPLRAQQLRARDFRAVDQGATCKQAHALEHAFLLDFQPQLVARPHGLGKTRLVDLHQVIQRDAGPAGLRLRELGQ